MYNMEPAKSSMPQSQSNDIEEGKNLTHKLLMVQTNLEKIVNSIKPYDRDLTEFSQEEDKSNNYVKSLIADLNIININLSNTSNEELIKLLNTLKTRTDELYALELQQIELIPKVKDIISNIYNMLKTDTTILHEKIQKTINTAPEVQTMVRGGGRSNKRRIKRSNKRKSKRRKSKRRRSNKRRSNKRRSKKDDIGDEIYMAGLVAAAVNIGDADSNDTTGVDI
jgi:hypothetical protein